MPALNLRLKILLAVGLLFSGLLGGTLLQVTLVQQNEISQEIEPQLREVCRGFREYQKQLQQLLAAQLEGMVAEGNFRHLLETMAGEGGIAENVVSCTEQAWEISTRSGCDLIVVADAGRRPLVIAQKTAAGNLVAERLPTSTEVAPRPTKMWQVLDGKAQPIPGLVVPEGTLLACDELGRLKVGAGTDSTPKATEPLFIDPSLVVDDRGTGAAAARPGRVRRPRHLTWRGDVYQVALTTLRQSETHDTLAHVMFAYRLDHHRLSDQMVVLRKELALAHGGRILVCAGGLKRDQVQAAYALESMPWESGTSESLFKHRSGLLHVDGERFHVVALDLEGASAELLVMASIKQALRLVNGLASRLRNLALAMLLLGIGAALLLARGISRPIEAMTRAMNRVASGDLEVEPLDARRSDEIGQLAVSFNRMVTELRTGEVLSQMVSQTAVARARGASGSGQGLSAVARSQRVEMSVMFSDVRDFTTISEQLSAEAVVELLNDHFAELGRVIRSHGGDIDKFIGDCVMATFPPRPGPGHAERAVLAALQMQQVVGARNAERRAQGRPEVLIGVGINSGEVVQGGITTEKRVEVTVLGDVVNVASRLEAFCKYGKHTKVVISESTYQSVASLVEVEGLEQKTVKGKSTPVQMYEVVGLLDRPTFMERLASTSADERCSAARILALAPRPEELDGLLKLLDDPEPSVRQVLASLIPLLKMDEEEAVRQLGSRLPAESAAVVRVALLQAIARLGRWTHVEQVVPYLTDPAATVRSTAVAAVASLGGRGTRHLLLTALSDPNQEVMTMAARAMADLGLWEVLDVLREGLESSTVPRRHAALAAVSSLATDLADRRAIIEIHHRRDAVSARFVTAMAALVATVSRCSSDEDVVVRAQARILESAMSGRSMAREAAQEGA